MRKQKLLIDFEFDFDVYGIVSTFKDYKLAWHINKDLHVNLSKKKDISIQFVDGELVISNYKYETDNSELQLLRNKSYELLGGDNQYLVPEMHRMDYFITLQGDINGWTIQEIQNRLQSTKGIDFVMKMDLDNLKSKENFIF